MSRVCKRYPEDPARDKLHGYIGVAFGLLQKLLGELAPLRPFAADNVISPLTVHDREKPLVVAAQPLAKLLGSCVGGPSFRSRIAFRGNEWRAKGCLKLKFKFVAPT